jgi:hypothetical protein
MANKPSLSELMSSVLTGSEEQQAQKTPPHCSRPRGDAVLTCRPLGRGGGGRSRGHHDKHYSTFRTTQQSKFLVPEEISQNRIFHSLRKDTQPRKEHLTSCSGCMEFITKAYCRHMIYTIRASNTTIFSGGTTK